MRSLTVQMKPTYQTAAILWLRAAGIIIEIPEWL